MLIYLLFCGSLYADVPDWAAPFMEMRPDPSIDEAVWRIYDASTITEKNGKIRIHRRVVQRALKQSGADEASTYTIHGNQDNSKIKKLKGWHVRPNGVIEKLDKDNVVTVSNSSSGEISQATTTQAFFEEVTRGSLIIFESHEVTESFFSLMIYHPLEYFPVRHLEINLVSESGKSPIFRTMGHEEWKIEPSIERNKVVYNHLPALNVERMGSDIATDFPVLSLGFFQGEDPLSSWDSLAKWYHGAFMRASMPSTPQSGTGDLAAAYQSLCNNIRYQQVYLSPERGWIPNAGQDVKRLAYGDCKDMVSCLAFEGKSLGYNVLPVLASIGDERCVMGPEDPTMNGFNHLIGAVELPKSLGLPAEFEIDGKLYVICDPTSQQTPFGSLPDYFRGLRVFMCTESAGKWIDIPEKALLSDRIDIQVQGNIDHQYQVEGTWKAVLHGNPGGIRSTFKTASQEHLTRRLHYYFGIPGYVDLDIQSAKIRDDQSLVIEAKLLWPHFLSRDAEGMRLPRTILVKAYSRLMDGGKERTMPIAFETEPKTTWDIQLSGPFAVQFGSEKEQFSNDHLGFEWQAKSGSGIHATYSTWTHPAHFGVASLADGEELWNAYRQAYNELGHNGSFLKIQP